MSASRITNNEQIEGWVAAAQGGDIQAFNRLYKLFVDGIYRYCLLKTSRPEVAQDLTSETFARLWRYLGRYKTQNFKSYVFTIARNLINDYYKQHAREIQTNDFDYLRSLAPSPEETIIQQENTKELYAALGKLPPHYREVLLLRYVEELNCQDVAKIMNKSYVTVRVLQHRALAKLKSLLHHKKNS